MDPIYIRLQETLGVARVNEPLRFGIPYPQGMLFDHQTIRIKHTTSDRTFPALSSPTAFWPDGSVRWLLLQSQVMVEPNSDTLLEVIHGAHNDETIRKWIETDSEWIYESYSFRHRVCKRTGRLYSQALGSHENSAWTTSPLWSDQWGGQNLPIVDSVEPIRGFGNCSQSLLVKAHVMKPDDGRTVRLEWIFHGHSMSGLVTIDATIHNPHRAQHIGGIWDLGDPGSVFFQELAFLVQGEDHQQSRISLDRKAPVQIVESSQSVNVVQESSGGEHWDNRNHIDFKGQLTVGYRGYRATVAGKNSQGLRAEPILECRMFGDVCTATIQRFWQNFPTSIAIRGNTLYIGLFPQRDCELYELQGGERKTQTFHIGFGSSLEDMLWTREPLAPIISPEHYCKAKPLPWFRPIETTGSLENLIRQGIDGASNFFAKREIIDEFGWRNFGDIFADHESLYLEEDEPPYVSHYNNQYDAIYGFARQYALMGDRRWFELMDDLANHVTDIDIYHTVEDRSEYNNGLFWHTDHYLDAHTATHRTFSKGNQTSSTPGQTGGGPGTEHCYTTGLMYHYFMTGNLRSAEAVLELAEWMVRLHEGQGGFLEQILTIKKQDLIKLKAVLKGFKPFSHRYAFTRGTGNYITALLDAWLLTEDRSWMNQLESVIKETIHPADDIGKRNLLDVENNWSYLILLSALMRYLSVKRDFGELDGCYGFTLESVRHYTRWMIDHERPFLADPEELEFPNDTWIAQDIRKAMLMFQAIDIDPVMGSRYDEQGKKWLDRLVKQLETSQERHLSRILVILMQNHGPHLLTDTHLNHSEYYAPFDLTKTPELTIYSLGRRIAHRFFQGLLQFRPSREYYWLKTRLDKR